MTMSSTVVITLMAILSIIVAYPKGEARVAADSRRIENHPPPSRRSLSGDGADVVAVAAVGERVAEDGVVDSRDVQRAEVQYGSGQASHGSTGITAYGKQHIPCCIDVRKDAYGNYRSKPTFDDLFFPKCPVHKGPATICEQATERFALEGTALYPRIYGGSNAYTVLLPTSIADHLADKTQLEEGFNGNRWISNQFADLAVIDYGCCYNIYPMVEPGLSYSAECNNPFLGDVTELDALLQYSMYLAGSFAEQPASATPLTATRSIIIGGDYKSGQTATIASADYTRVGSFSGIGLFVGGDILAGAADGIVVTNGLIEAGSDSNGRISTSYTPVSAARRTEAVAIISSQVCALSHQIQSLEENGYYFFDNLNGELFFNCPAAANPCVINMDTEDFSTLLPTAWSITIPSTETTAKINVFGSLLTAHLQTTVALAFNTAAAADTHIVWNFVNAKIVLIESEGPFFHSILAPLASLVSVNLVTSQNIQGAVIMGHPEGHLNYSGLGTINTDSVTVATCPAPEPFVTLCDCLCPADSHHH